MGGPPSVAVGVSSSSAVGGSTPAAPGARGAAPSSRPPLPFGFRFFNVLISGALWLTRIRVVVEGGEHVPDASGVILVNNHLSILDPPLICLTVAHLRGRRVRFMAKAESMATPILGPVLDVYGGFGVRRGQPDRDAFRRARAVLAHGEWLGVAPEGTRSRSGVMGEPKPGVALLALRSDALILPVGIFGTERAWPIGARLPRPGTTVTIRFGRAYLPPPPADPGPEAAADGLGRRDRRGELTAAADEMMHRIAELLPPSYRGRFG